MEISTIESYLNAIDSKSSTPGGGSVAALVGELGVCLARMYGHLSLNTKAFIAQDEQDKGIFIEHMNILEKARIEIHQFISEDMLVYEAFCVAYKDQSNERERNIQRATYRAMDVPLKCMRVSLQVMLSCAIMLKLGNKRAISDCAIACVLCHAAIESSYLNVLINLVSYKNEEENKKTLIEIDEIRKKSEQIKEECIKVAIEVIKG